MNGFDAPLDTGGYNRSDSDGQAGSVGATERRLTSTATLVITDVGETIHRLRKEQGELKRQLADVDNQLIDALAEMKARLFALDFSREAAGIVANLPALRKGPQSETTVRRT